MSLVRSLLTIIVGTFPYANNFRKGISVGADEANSDGEEEQATQEDDEMEVDTEHEKELFKK